MLRHLGQIVKFYFRKLGGMRLTQVKPLLLFRKSHHLADWRKIFDFLMNSR
jgi:hypothetical protein